MIDFRKMSKKEATSFLESFLENGGETARAIEDMIGLPHDYYEPSTLIPFWRYFRTIMKKVDLPESALPKDMPSIIREEGLLKDTWFTLDPFSFEQALGVAFHYGQVYVYQNNQLKWAVCQNRKDLNYNQPVIDGFLMRLEVNPFKAINKFGCQEFIVGKGSDDRLLKHLEEMMKYAP